MRGRRRTEEQRERGGNVTGTTLARMSDPLFEFCQPRYIFRFAPRVQKRLYSAHVRASSRLHLRALQHPLFCATLSSRAIFHGNRVRRAIRPTIRYRHITRRSRGSPSYGIYREIRRDGTFRSGARADYHRDEDRRCAVNLWPALRVIQFRD